MGKFCTRCGTPLNAGAKFCASCGADSSQQKPIGMGKFISQYIRRSLKVLKDPKQMIPTIVLGLFWLVLALLGSFGINPMPFASFPSLPLHREECLAVFSELWGEFSAK